MHLQLCDIFWNLTFVRNIGPLRVGELVLAHPDPLLHAGGDGLARVGVEWWKPAQTTDGKQKDRHQRVQSKRTIHANSRTDRCYTHRIYMITPRDHMSHDLSYFSGPRTSGAE